MIQAIRAEGDLPGGVPAFIVREGDHVVLVMAAWAADHRDGRWRFSICNSLLDELSDSGGDYCVDGMLGAVVGAPRTLPAPLLAVNE